MDNSFNLDQLRQFTGSEDFFRHWCNSKIVYTEGVRYLARNARCLWLIDEIALNLFPRLLGQYEDVFYRIEFVVHLDRSANINVDDGNGNLHFRHKIEWTDFPVLEEPVIFYLCESGDQYCLMLSREY